MSRNRECPAGGEDLLSHALGELEEREERAVAEHLEECPRCRRELAALKAFLAVAEGLPRVGTTEDFRGRLRRRLHREITRATPAAPAPTGAKEAGAAALPPLTVRDRFVLAAGLIGFSLRRSLFARTLFAAALIQIVFLAVLGVLLAGGRPGSASKAASAPEELSPPAGPGGASRWHPLPPAAELFPLHEDGPRRRRGLGIERLEPPERKPDSPMAEEVAEADVLGGKTGKGAALIPDDDIRSRIERENAFELCRYRMFARCSPSCKRRVMKGRGGDERTTYAVGRGLKWLSLNQEPDGSWDPARFLGDPRTRVGLTALSVAAFLSDGSSENSGRYAGTVSKGINYLLASRDRQGRFGAPCPDPVVTLFNQSVAVLALAENYILTGGRNEDETRRGMNRLVSLVEETGEGPGTYGDTWAAMALRTAIMSGIGDGRTAAVSRRVEERVALLARAERRTAGPVPSRPPLFSAGIEAVDALFAEKEEVGPASTDDVVPFPDWRKPETMFALIDDAALREPAFLFFISTALCEDGRPAWPEWNRRVKALLIGEQDEDGRWKAGGRWPWIDGGDIYTTALSVLTLQVYYRFIKLEENCP